MPDTINGFLREDPTANQSMGPLVVSVSNSAGGGASEATLATRASEATLEAVRVLLAAEDFASETKLEAVRVLLAGTLAVSVAALPLPAGAATSALQGTRYAGGKTPVTAQVTAAGDTTVYTPAAGKRVRLFWVSAINDPDQSVSPRIIVKFAGGTELYRAAALAHWEIFEGALNEAVVVNLDQAADVAVTLHLQEF